MHGPHIPQERKLVTAVPGPKSQELVRRRGEAVSAGLGMAVPVEGAKVILNALLMTFAGKNILLLIPATVFIRIRHFKESWVIVTSVPMFTCVNISNS